MCQEMYQFQAISSKCSFKYNHNFQRNRPVGKRLSICSSLCNHYFQRMRSLEIQNVISVQESIKYSVFSHLPTLHACFQKYCVSYDKTGCSSVGQSIGPSRHQHRFDSPEQQDIFFPESTFSAYSLSVSIQPRVQLYALTSVRRIKLLQSISEFGGL